MHALTILKTLLLRLLNLIFPSERASEAELISIGYQQALHDMARQLERPPELPKLMHVARIRTQPLPGVPAFPTRFHPTDMDAMRGATHSGAFASDRADAWVNEPGVDETKRRLHAVRLEGMR